MITKTHVTLIVATLIASSALAGRDCDTCKRASLKPLDLSRTPTHEELILSGQLGGNLAPTGPESDSIPEDRLSFGRAMDTWNRHDYKNAKALLKQHIQKFPGSPWKAEAILHLGCEARFNGRYAEAEDFFAEIMAEHEGKRGTAEGEILHRAELRLAMLATMRGDFAAAKEKWAEILRNDSDRVRRDYARHWLFRVGLYEQNAATVRRCGTEALAKLFVQMGQVQAAREVLALPANPKYGFRADELVTIARRHGVKLAGVMAKNAKHLPTPFLAHYEFKHFVVVNKTHADGSVTLFDPILNHEAVMSADEFAREWSGVALIPENKNGLLAGLWNGVARLWRNEPEALALAVLSEFTGGCCGIENPNTDEGANVFRIGGSRCKNSFGMSTWSFAPASVNIFVTDTPLWYEPAIGPAIAFSMSYNAIDADNNLTSFGPKWIFNYHSYCVETPAAGDGMVTVFMPDGRNDVYSPDGTNTYTPPGRVFNQLVKIGTNAFSLTMPDGTIYHYGQPTGATNVQQALLSSIEDRHSNTVTLVYDGQPDPKLIAVVDALAQTSRIFYAGSGMITNIMDPFGREMTVIYSNEHVATVRDMGGVESHYTFYTNGLQQDYVQTLRTDCGSVSFDYALADGSAMGTWDRSTLTATYADGSTEVLYYNGGESYPASTYYTDRNGHRTKFAIGLGTAFPYQGRINSAEYQDGTQAEYEYNAALQVTNVTDEAGQSWGYDYNDQGRLTDVLTPSGYQLSFVYTNGGFDLARVTEAGSITLASMTYTEKRDVATITNALNEAIRFGYDGFGRLTNAVDSMSLETVMEYGANGWVSAVKREGITLAEFQQDEMGRTTNSVGPEHIPVAFSFDNLNRLSSLAVSATEQPYKWTYQTNSLLLEKQTDRSGRRTSLEYDELERIAKVRGPDASYVSFEYDSADNLSALLDGKGSRTRFAYDARDRLTQKTWPGGGGLSVAYDSRGLPVSHTGGRGFVTLLGYNGDGLLTNVAYSATNTPEVRYSYDSRNLLISSADGWSTNSCGYDLLGRLTNLMEIGIAGTQQFFYAYDSLGQLTNLLWQCGTNSINTSYGYDSLGRVTNLVSDSGAYVYAYTNAGLQVSRLTYPNGEYVSSEYDSLGRLTNLAYSTGGSWTYAYDARDFVIRRVNPAGEVFTYQYDDAGRLTEAIGLSGTNAISGYPLRYRYDKAGNRISQTEGQKQRNLAYNEDNQLLSSARTNILTVRGYVNEAGSRVEAKSNSATNWIEGTVSFISSTQSYFEINGILTTNIYPSSNTVWVRAFDVSNNVSTSVVHTAYSSTSKLEYEYDADGNLAEFPAPVQFYKTNVQYSWDAENRLTSMVWRTKPQITNYFLVTTNKTFLYYDGAGRLRQTSEYGTNSTPTVVVRFVWNGWTLAGELDGSNKLVRTYTYGVDLSGTFGGAAGIGGLVGIRSYVAPVTNYYTRQDGKGNVIEVRRYNGTTAASYGYYEFGDIRYQTNTYMQSIRWQTRMVHPQSGLYFWPQRIYDPATGRWCQRDRIGEAGGINIYQYVGGNPIGSFDPLGLDFIYIVDAEAVAGHGHAAAITGPVNGQWRYDSFGVPRGFHRHGQYLFDTEQRAMEFARRHGYTRFARWQTRRDQDIAAQEQANLWHAGSGQGYQMFREYKADDENCQSMVNDMARAAEIQEFIVLILQRGVNHPNVTMSRVLYGADESGVFE